jgi:hypothetical protein
MNRITRFFILSLFITTLIYSQEPFYFNTYWQIEVKGGIYNIETADINRDGHLDIVSGNFNNTYVFFGGKALLDSTVDIVYTGRCLAITDYNGDGIKDMITMNFTSYDSLHNEYAGDLLFYMGKNTGQYLFDTVPDYTFPLPTQHPNGEQFSVGNGKPGVRVGDINNDGKMDLVISTQDWGNILGKLYIYLGKDIPNGIPDFIIEPNYPRGNNITRYFEVGDINGDHYDDLLFSERVRSRVGPSYDTLSLLYIYYGSQNQIYDINNPSILYKSKVDTYSMNADWFLNYFSLDDINCDGYKDLVVDRVDFKPDSITAVHFGRPGFNGFDTIPNLKIKLPDPIEPGIVGRGISQNVGDYNSDGYDDFILCGPGSIFWMILGGPHFNNNNPYGICGQLNALSYPYKALQVGDQGGYGGNDIIVSILSDQIGWGHIQMFIGNSSVKTDIKKELDLSTKKETILNAYPNPFNSQIKITYNLKNRGQVNLKLYNSIGQEIALLKNEYENAGVHEINYRNEKLSSGIYFLTLNQSGEIVTQKIVLTK